jgi:NAD(P)-dependent dehydrogenase (short-subunit alcohol dehydrogenase family)
MERTCLITGSGKRLGRSLALLFAEKKWNVILHSFHSNEQAQEVQKLIEKKGSQVFHITFDLTKVDEIINGFAEISKNFIFPDILINNAAIYPQQIKIEDITENFWDIALDTNLKSQFFTAKEFAKFAKAGSRIINIASLGAFSIWNDRLPYNVSKAGVIQLTKALAKGLAPKISVNSVSPGTIDLQDAPPSEPLQINAEKIPFKRLATASDIFDAVYFFATCTNYITGQNINVDGGFSL